MSTPDIHSLRLGAAAAHGVPAPEQADTHCATPAETWAAWSEIICGSHIGDAIATLELLGCLPAKLSECRTTPQDPTWHPEGDVLTHQCLAADHAAEAAGDLDADSRAVAVLGALLHDVGKTVATRIVDGRITSRGHATLGRPIAAAILTEIGAPEHIIERVCAVVAEHMCHVAAHATPSRRAARALVERLAPATLDDWVRVVDADCAGRGSGAKLSTAAAWITAAESSPRQYDAQTPLLKGHHIIAAGYVPGPGWAALIRASLDAQAAGSFTDEDSAAQWLATSGLAPVGFPARPSHSQQNKTRKWIEKQSRPPASR